MQKTSSHEVRVWHIRVVGKYQRAVTNIGGLLERVHLNRAECSIADANKSRDAQLAGFDKEALQNEKRLGIDGLASPYIDDHRFHGVLA